MPAHVSQPSMHTPWGTAVRHRLQTQEVPPATSQASAVQGLMTGAAGRQRRHADHSSRRQQRDALREQRRRWVELGELGDLPGELALLCIRRFTAVEACLSQQLAGMV